MKTKIFTLVAVLLLACNIYSQQENLKEESNEDLWALQFQISSNFTLSTFSGSTLSLKRKLSDHTSLRFGLGINSTIYDADWGINSSIDEEATNESDDNETKYSFDLSALYLWNTKIKNEVSAYYGIGPSLGYSYYKRSQGNTNTSSNHKSSTINNYTSNVLGFGTIGALGVEWYVRENISILAEYSAAITYNFQSENKDSNQSYNSSNISQREERRTDNFRFSSLGAKLGVAIYF